MIYMIHKNFEVKFIDNLSTKDKEEKIIIQKKTIFMRLSILYYNRFLKYQK